jgi:geranylgeranyl transferase type-1 subunit beta
VDIDPAKLALSFYCLGSLDVSGELEKKTRDWEREQWREWIWGQQTSGYYGTGFRASSYMTAKHSTEEYASYDNPQIIMTYTALLSLSILRDDFSRLDRKGLLKFLRSCQNIDGSFSSEPLGGDSDLRTTFCAFAISTMLDDWSGMNIASALQFIYSCRTYEGGYGQSPFGEALGGTTYCALAALQLVTQQPDPLSLQDRQKTVRWLVQNQASNGGFSGRTNKDADACYCFWCGASLHMLDAGDLVDKVAMSSFIASCQFKYGGIAKIPGEHPDPYHTYLSLAAVALLPPNPSEGTSWALSPLDPLLNATYQTSSWARAHIPAPKVDDDAGI